MGLRLTDLNTAEWHTLTRLERGGPLPNVATEAVVRLIELGLAERQPGGIGMTRAGKNLLASAKPGSQGR
jgi:hypothetical protein